MSLTNFKELSWIFKGMSDANIRRKVKFNQHVFMKYTNMYSVQLNKFMFVHNTASIFLYP